MLRIRSKSMFGTDHSWAVTMRSIFREFIRMQHKISITSTNGDELIPDEWLRYMLSDCESPDLDICYTLPNNFKRRFKETSKLKVAIYNYETNIMPYSWSDNEKYIDYILPSSVFSKNILIKNGWPEGKIVIIPHGIESALFERKDKFILNTNKKFKFLNVSIPHKRKNLATLIDCYYECFSSDDDVCLVVKTKLLDNKLRAFEVNVVKEVFDLQRKYTGKSLPQIEIVKDSLDSMVPLYNACDCLVSASSSEGFGMPFLEAMAANMLVIAPGCSGQVDFLNKNNSLVINTYQDKAPLSYQYWEPSDDAVTFFPDRNSIIENMLKAYKEKNNLLSNFNLNCKNTISKYTWESAAKKILELK